MRFSGTETHRSRHDCSRTFGAGALCVLTGMSTNFWTSLSRSAGGSTRMITECHWWRTMSFQDPRTPFLSTDYCNPIIWSQVWSEKHGRPGSGGLFLPSGSKMGIEPSMFGGQYRFDPSQFRWVMAVRLFVFVTCCKLFGIPHRFAKLFCRMNEPHRMPDYWLGFVRKIIQQGCQSRGGINFINRPWCLGLLFDAGSPAEERAAGIHLCFKMWKFPSVARRLW